MMNEEQAKGLVESLTPLQEAGEKFPCPRCGHDRMNEKPVRNALSRRANVYICNECGSDEALRDLTKCPPLPFTQWGMVLGFQEEE